MQSQLQEVMAQKQDSETKAEGYRAEWNTLRNQLGETTTEWQRSSQAATESERKMKEEERRRIEADSCHDDLIKQMNTLKVELEQQKQAASTHTAKEKSTEQGAGPSKSNTSHTTTNIQNNNSPQPSNTPTETQTPLARKLREVIAANVEKDKRIAELEKQVAANNIHHGSGMSKQISNITKPQTNSTQNTSNLSELNQRLQAKLKNAMAKIESQQDEILRLKYHNSKLGCAAAEIAENAATSIEKVEVLEATVAKQTDEIKNLDIRNTSLQLHMTDMYEKYVRGPQAEKEKQNIPKTPGYRGQSSLLTVLPAQMFSQVLIVLICVGLYGVGGVFC